MRIDYAEFKRCLLKEKNYYFIIVTRLFSAPMAYAAYRLGISANQMTALGMLLGVPAFILMSQGRMLEGIVVFHLFFLIDCMDGVLARATKTQSTLGAYLDDLAHYVFHTLFIAGMAYYMLVSGRERFAIALVVFMMANNLNRAHLDLLGRICLKSGIASGDSPSGDGVCGMKTKIRNALQWSFGFPNALVWMTILIWNLQWMEYYFLYAAATATLFFVYKTVKVVRVGFALSGASS